MFDMVNLHSIRIFHSADTGENIGGNSGEKSTEMPEGFDKEFWDSLSEEHRKELRNLSKDTAKPKIINVNKTNEQEGPVNSNFEENTKPKTLGELIVSKKYPCLSNALSVYQRPKGEISVPLTILTVLDTFDNEELKDLDNLLKENGIEFGGNLENLLYVTINFCRKRQFEAKPFRDGGHVVLKPTEVEKTIQGARYLVIDDIKDAFEQLKDVHKNPVIAVEIQTAADIKEVSATTIKNRMIRAGITDSDFNEKGEVHGLKKVVKNGTGLIEIKEGIGLLDALEEAKR